MKDIKVAIMGMGTIGSGVYKVIETEGAQIARNEGVNLSVKYVLAKSYSIPIPDEKKISTVEEIANDPEISIVVEVMGGKEPACTFIKTCLKAGKTVVSANKDLISQKWEELESAAREAGTNFYFEASVGGGIPILRAVNECLQANTMQSIMGIINGTTNYILTSMTDDGGDYADVLKEAQELGFAEANPTYDVDGFDAMYKLSILSSMAFKRRLTIDHIYREGIRDITAKDIAYAKELGMCIKLLAIGKLSDSGEVELRVHPTMIPYSNPLASVKGSFNAILMHGSAIDDVMFYGRGAGDLPTASAIVSDIICAAKGSGYRYMRFFDNDVEPLPTTYNTDWECGCYLRVKVVDKPGIMAKICDIIGTKGVNIASVIQKDCGSEGETDVVFVLKEARESAVSEAIKEIEAADGIIKVVSRIRIEE